MTLLLTSVFGPYGVDDQFGTKENIMELFHNQVTREQGAFSPRLNHESTGLHMIAANLKTPTVILDFPSQQRFISEIKKGYDYIGISFIVPNFLKAKRMAELVRKNAPQTKIILGGHGCSIADIDRMIPCDHVCRGEGIGFLRRLFGEDINAPIRQPFVYSAFNEHVTGIPIKPSSAMLMTGVGCVNGCRFCSTSHFFQKVYTPFLNTGKDIFSACLEIENTLGVTEFFVMDENFLKAEERARELVDEMEKNNKAYAFNIFSSAETVTRMGVDFLDRLGVNFLWMGVESQKEAYEKNKGIDFESLIKQLRNRGIAVLASGILFNEDHDKHTIHDEIDFMVGLNADLVQFMQLSPLPGTALYKDYESKKKLNMDVSYKEWHGQHQIWFSHPHFSAEESAHYLKNAFTRDFEINGPSVLRLADTAIRGAIASQHYTSDFMRLRHAARVKRANVFYPTIAGIRRFAPNQAARKLADSILHRYDTFYKKQPFAIKLKSIAAQILLAKEILRTHLIHNNMRQPKTLVTRYRMAPETISLSSRLHQMIQYMTSTLATANSKIPLIPFSINLRSVFEFRFLRVLWVSFVKFIR